MPVTFLKKSGFSRPEIPSLATLQTRLILRGQLPESHTGNRALWIIARQGSRRRSRRSQRRPSVEGTRMICSNHTTMIGNVCSLANIHVARHATRNRMIPYLTVTPRSRVVSANSRTACCAEPLPRPYLVQRLLCWQGQLNRGCLHGLTLTHRALLVTDSVASLQPLPKAPNSTFVIERFIARHIRIERMKPEKVSVPAMIKLCSIDEPCGRCEPA